MSKRRQSNQFGFKYSISNISFSNISILKLEWGLINYHIMLIIWIFYNTCIYQQWQIIKHHPKCILHCISIKYKYSTLITVYQSIDRHTTKQSGLVYVKYHPNTRVGFQTIKHIFYLCSWAMYKIYRPNQCHSNRCT